MTHGADDSDLIIPGQPEQLDDADVQSLEEDPFGEVFERLQAAELEAGTLEARAYGAELGFDDEPLSEDSLALAAYSEDDNVVTEEVGGMLHEPRWLVQFSTLDRRMMDTSEVISALIEGAIRRDTPVWRGGMDDWLPVGQLDLLSPSALPTLPPQRRTIKPTTLEPLHRARPLEVALASLAIALSAATVTTSMLSIAGVFDSEEKSAPTSVRALRAERARTAPVADEVDAIDEVDERNDPAVVRDMDGRPPAPDPERATAVAH
ncbi:MAG TPA: DUF4339 domain-containing protein [Polyangiaceae bacterium]|nr:DUF4339 domain-containing protein [Polyangiaceae bacterium]